MTSHTHVALVSVIIILSLTVAFVMIHASDASTRDLVVNGGFEDGMQGWEPGPTPLAPGGVDVAPSVSRTGLHSLRLIGPGDGFLQKLEPRSIFPEMQLSFYTLLNATDGENLPQALFHLYFLPTTNGPTYYVDITVTLTNNEDLAAVFEPNPDIDTGGIYLRFNREPVNTWIHISVDISKLLERYFPDFFDPQINRIMLESAEGGKVYFDDISIKSTNFVFIQSIYLIGHFIVHGTAPKTVSQLLGFTVIGGIIASIIHWWRGIRKRKN